MKLFSRRRRRNQSAAARRLGINTPHFGVSCARPLAVQLYTSPLSGRHSGTFSPVRSAPMVRKPGKGSGFRQTQSYFASFLPNFIFTTECPQFIRPQNARQHRRQIIAYHHYDSCTLTSKGCISLQYPKKEDPKQKQPAYIDK